MKIVITIIIGVCFLWLLGNYIEQYSKESFRTRTEVYALQYEEGWSEKQCDSLVSQKEDSLLDSYFPGISILLK